MRVPGKSRPHFGRTKLLKSYWRYVLFSMLGAAGPLAAQLAAQVPSPFESDAVQLRRPSRPVLQSPFGIITTPQPSYVWTAVSTATDYLLRVNGPSGKVTEESYEAAAVCSGSTCAVAPATTLASGAHTWWVRASNEAGVGWPSARGKFTVQPQAGTDAYFPPGAVWYQDVSGAAARPPVEPGHLLAPGRGRLGPRADADRFLHRGLDRERRNSSAFLHSHAGSLQSGLRRRSRTPAAGRRPRRRERLRVRERRRLPSHRGPEVGEPPLRDVAGQRRSGTRSSGDVSRSGTCRGSTDPEAAARTAPARTPPAIP